MRPNCGADGKGLHLLLLHLHTPSQSIAGRAFEMHILVSVGEKTKLSNCIIMTKWSVHFGTQENSHW